MSSKQSQHKATAAGGKSAKAAKAPPVSATNLAAVKQFFNLISLDIDVDRARQLQLRSKAITTLPPQLGTILGQVQKLDLSQNDIRDLSPLGSLPHLTNLTLTGNAALKTLESLSCTRLVVLAVANCGLESLRGLTACRATLRALIANDNNIRLQSPAAVEEAGRLQPYVQPAEPCAAALESYEALAAMDVCDTIVLSRNPQLSQLYVAPLFHDPAARLDSTRAASSPEEPKEDEDPATTIADDKEMAAPADPEVRQLIASAHPLSVFEKLAQLKKLSISECGLTSLPLRWFLPVVTELRLAKNGLRSFQPDGVICRSLKILDISHNQVEALATLRRCRFLKQLNLRGNPLVAHYQDRDMAEGFRSAASSVSTAHAVPITLMRSLPHLFSQLEQVDGQPMLNTEDFEQRQKRAREETAMEATAEPVALAPATKVAAVETKPAAASAPRESKAERAARVATEEEAKDVVTEAPESVAKSSRVPVVRRERNLMPAASAKPKVTGGEAIAKLAAQRSQTSAW